MGHGELQQAGPRRRLACMHGRDAGGDDAEAAITVDAPVQAAALVPLGNPCELLAQTPVGRAGVGGDHDPGRDVAHKQGGVGRLGQRDLVHDGLRVADAGRHAQDDRIPKRSDSSKAVPVSS